MCALFLSVISWPAAGSESASDCDSALRVAGGSRCPAGSAVGWTVAIIAINRLLLSVMRVYYFKLK